MANTFDGQAALRHIERLAADNDVEIHYEPCQCGKCPPFGSSNPFLGTVMLTHLPTTEEAYAVALHEFGHQLSPKQQFDVDVLWCKSRNIPHVGIWNNEADAWRWARGVALVWTPKMQKWAERCLATYGEHYAAAA